MSEHRNAEPDILRFFHSHGYKATPQRLAVARYMIHNKNHPTAREIYLGIKPYYPSISLTTVYKTVGFLNEANFLQRINVGRAPTRFDPNTKFHAHLVCAKCGGIQDYMDPSTSKLSSKILDETGFIADGSNFNIIGICKKCQKILSSAIDAEEVEPPQPKIRKTNQIAP